METLILTDDEVKNLLFMPEVIEAVESAFKQKVLDTFRCPQKFTYTTRSKTAISEPCRVISKTSAPQQLK